MTAELSVGRSGGWVTLEMETGRLDVRGELELDSASLVQAELTLLLQAGAGRQVVDLSGVTMLSAAGVEALENVWRMAHRSGIDLHVVTARDSVAAHILGMLGMTIDSDAVEGGAVGCGAQDSGAILRVLTLP